MKNYKKFSHPLLLVLILFSCNNRAVKKQWAKHTYGDQSVVNAPLIKVLTDSLRTISVKKNDKDKVIHLPEFISEYHYVPLETQDTALIGLIDKIIVKKDRIYILDQLQAQSVFIFDWSGNLLNVIHHKGKGPGEYTNLRDMSVAADGSVYVYDGGQGKLIQYDQEGNFIHEKRKSFYFDYLLCDNDGGLIFSTDYNSQNYHRPQLHCYNLLMSDTSMTINNKALPYSKKNLLIRSTNGPDFFVNDNKQYYNPYLCDTIYQIDAKNVRARYVIDFEGEALFRTDLKGKELKNEEDGLAWIREARKSAQYLLHPFAFSDRFVHVQVSNGGKWLYSVYYDTQKDKVYAGNKIDYKGVKNLFVYSSPEAGYGDYLIGYVNASIFVKGWEKYKNHIDAKKLLAKNIYEKYEQVKITDNPVIFFAKTK